MDTILFDMDGTLLDTLDDLHASVNYALGRAELPLVTFDETREAAGYGSIVLIELLTKHAFATGSPEFQRVFDDFNAHYKEHCNDRTHPYPGVLELLAGLGERGLKMAIVSNKIQPETEALRELWFSDFIPVAVGRVEGIAPKPDPAMALAALERLGSRPGTPGSSAIPSPTSARARTRVARVSAAPGGLGISPPSRRSAPISSSTIRSSSSTSSTRIARELAQWA